MSDTLFAEASLIDELEWDDLLLDINKRRCILFLGPTLPVYTNGKEKFDFYCKASMHLAAILKANDIPFDDSQSGNLQYTGRRFLAFKRNVRIRLDDEIGNVYNLEKERVLKEGVSAISDLYKNIAALPWHTIVNTQPDQFLEIACTRKVNFHYYHYQSPGKTQITGLDADTLLIYNLFGTLIKEDNDYNLESLILTEEDQVDFMRNVIKDNPQIPESVVSRFDGNKRYIFLDFNLENWHFRLLLEALKLKKNFLPISPKHLKINFSFYTKDFYKNRYGFLFVKDNSEEFIEVLVKKYYEKFPQIHQHPPVKKKLFIACRNEDEINTKILINHLNPWIKKDLIEIWFNGDLRPGARLDLETSAFKEADCIVLIISADALNEPFFSKYIQSSLQASSIGKQKIIAVILRECAWTETGLNQGVHILPYDKKALSTYSEREFDEQYKLTAFAISKILW